MIAVYIFFLQQYSLLFCLLGFSANLFMMYQRLERRKKMKELYFPFFVSFILNVFVFVYNRLKQSLILQKTRNCFSQISIFSWHFYVNFEIESCAVCDDLVTSCCYVRHIFLHLLFSFAKCINLTRETFCISREKCAYFLETMMYKCSIF